MSEPVICRCGKDLRKVPFSELQLHDSCEMGEAELVEKMLVAFYDGGESHSGIDRNKERMTAALRVVLARLISERLFTNGAGVKANRLVLELPGKKDGGGWCQNAVEDLIVQILAAGCNRTLGRIKEGQCED